MAEGKWKNMMSANPHPQPVFKMPAVATTQPLGESGVGVAIEGQGFAQTAKSSSNQLPQFSEFVPTRRFIDLFNTGGGAVDWSATATEPWIRLSSSAGHPTGEERIWVTVDAPLAPTGDEVRGTIQISSGATRKTVSVVLFNPHVAVPR